MGKKTIQVWRRVATQWEDAMSYDFFLLFFFVFVVVVVVVFTVVHPSLSISSFLNFVVIFIWTDFLIMVDFFSSDFWEIVDHRKWEPWLSDQVLLVIPFLWIHVSSFLFLLFLPLSLRHKSIPVRPGIITTDQTSPASSLHNVLHVFLRVVFIYLMSTFVWLVFFHVTSWHFVLTWLLSLSLSRRGIMWRSCVHDTGFCECVGVCQGQVLVASRPGDVPCREVRQALL